MRTFKSTDLNRAPAEVFEAAVEDGAVKINHNGYRDTMFVLSARRRGMTENQEEEVKKDEQP